MECGKPHLILRSFNPFISLLFRLFHLPPLGQVAIVVGTKGNPRPQRGNLGNFNLKKKKKIKWAGHRPWPMDRTLNPTGHLSPRPLNQVQKNGENQWPSTKHAGYASLRGRFFHFWWPIGKWQVCAPPAGRWPFIGNNFL